MTTAPFAFSMTFAEAIAAGLQPDTRESLESGMFVRVEDGRYGRFVCRDVTSPHPVVWVSLASLGEFAHMLSRAHAANEEAARTA